MLYFWFLCTPLCIKTQKLPSALKEVQLFSSVRKQNKTTQEFCNTELFFGKKQIKTVMSISTGQAGWLSRKEVHEICYTPNLI